MGRGKLPLRLIEKERARRITCSKRKKGLVKKAYELSTLCDIRVCLVIHDSDAPDGNCLKTFPEHPRDVNQIVSDYYASKAKNPANSKRDLTLADFYADRLRRLRSDAHRHPFLVWDSRIDAFTPDQLLDLMAHLDRKIDEVTKLKADRQSQPQPLQSDYDTSSNNMMMMMMDVVQAQDHPWFHHHQHHDPPANTNNALVISSGFDHQAMPFDPTPWSLMNNLPYYTRLLEAPDLCALGTSAIADNRFLNNSDHHHRSEIAALQPYSNMLYGSSSSGPLQYFPAMYPFGSSDASGSQEDVKFDRNSANHFYAASGSQEDVKFDRNHF